MSIRIRTENAKIAWLSKKTNVGGKLVDGQAILYVFGSPFKKLGQVTRESKAGLTPQEAVEARYAGMKSVLGQDLIIHAIIVIDAEYGSTYGYDDNLRCFISALHDKGVVSFSANYGEFQKENTNSEALLNYSDADYDALIKASQQWIGVTNWFNVKDPISWRYHQEEDVKEIFIKLIEFKEALYAAYTGRGKTLIALEVVVRLLNELNRGGIVLVTTPISDTKNSFKKVLDTLSLGFDRETKISYYDSSDFSKQDITDLENRAKNGEIIFVILTVQDLRYKDKDPNIESVVLRQKYESLGDKVTVWIRDERHKEYEGEQTLKQLECVKPEYYLDLTATPYNVQEKYSEKTIISRSLLWGLLNKKNTGLPGISIEVLQNLMFDSFPNIGGLFSEEEGYDPRKLFVRQNGNFCLAKELVDLFTLMYASPLSKEKNKLSISNDCGLSEVSKRAGLVVLPEGQDGDSVSAYIPALANLLNQNVKGNVLFVDAYSLEQDYNAKRKQVGPNYTIGDYVEDLLKDHEKVIILTCGKFTTGTDIPPLGHIVIFDKISSLAVFEQLLGRMIRVYDGKNKVKCYCFAPGHTIRLMLGQMALINKNLGEGAEFEILDCVPLTEYEGTDFKKVSPEEIIGELQKHFFELIRRKLPGRTLHNRLVEMFNENDWDKKELEKFKTSSIEAEMSDDTGAKVKEKLKGSEREKGKKKKSNLLEKVELLLQEVYNELRWISYTNPDLDLEESLDRDELIRMFSSVVMGRVKNEINKNWKLRRFIWDELNKVKLAFKDASDEELSKCIFYNTAFKQKTGLVYTPWELGEELVGKIKEQYVAKNPPKRILAVNALNGVFPLILRREFPDAEIVCLEYFSYFKKYLEDKGFEVIMWEKDMDTGGMKFDVVVGNPPFSDGSHGAAPIYLNFIEKLVKITTGVLAIVSPNAWTGSGFNNTKNEIVNCGLKDLRHLKVGDIFDIKMNLCYFVCVNGYMENINIQYSSGFSSQINRVDDLFDLRSNSVRIFLNDNLNGTRFKLLKNKTRKFSYYDSGNQASILTTITVNNGPVFHGIAQKENGPLIDRKDEDRWKIAFGEYCRGMIAIIPPGVIVPNTFFYLAYDSENDAKQIFDYFMSPAIRWIVSETRATRTLCGATLRYVPFKDPHNTSLKIDPIVQQSIDSIGGKVPY